jgi:hypothetical protein
MEDNKLYSLIFHSAVNLTEWVNDGYIGSIEIIGITQDRDNNFTLFYKLK